MTDSYYFLPWVRYGVLAALSPQDSLGSGVPTRARLPIRLRLVGTGPGTRSEDVVSLPSLHLLGPGDVLGFDPREVVRTTPRHLTSDFPANLLASIEFDRPDFPWLLTPASPNQDRLRPWVVLVVARKRVSSLTFDTRRPLPVLECPAAELPDLADSWRWAHAQFAGSVDRAMLPRALADQPHHNVSRLLCPRQLEASAGGPDAGYYACVVPAFEIGRLAGLGEATPSADGSTLAAAWDFRATTPVKLPVYYAWEFSVGAASDFEHAVDQIRLITTWPAAEPRSMNMSLPGGGLPQFGGVVLSVPSALWPKAIERPPEPDALQTIKDEMGQVLDAPLGVGREPHPPTYGQWQATDVPAWLRELNLDPRYRMVAALGGSIVQQQQEQLVAAAWEQAGQAEAVNQWLRQKQLALEVNRSIYDKRLSNLSEGSLAQILAPVAVPGGLSGSSVERPSSAVAMSPSGPTVDNSAPEMLVDALVSSPFRRIGRRTTELSGVLDRAVLGNVSTLDMAGPSPSAMLAPSAPAPARQLLGRLDPALTFGTEIAARVRLPAPAPTPAAPAAAAPAPAPPSAAPAITAIKPVLVGVDFPQPMAEPLRELSADVLLPGLERIPNNSMTLLAVDGRFIEAFMIGLNDAFSRELLWREFPARLEYTYFRQFWDVRGQLPPTATADEHERLRDIPQITQWRGQLGSHLKPGRNPSLMLLIKGDLLLRFPTALIYAARGAWSRDSNNQAIWPPLVDDAQSVFPAMRVNLGDGVTLLGFSLMNPDQTPVTEHNVAGGAPPNGDPGWFFILAEHPTEPRYGLDMPAWQPPDSPRPADEPLHTWRELTWRDVAFRTDGSGYLDVNATTVSLVAPPETAPAPVRARYERERRDVVWGANAASMAYITLQQAYRQEVHAGFWFAE